MDQLDDLVESGNFGVVTEAEELSMLQDTIRLEAEAEVGVKAETRSTLSVAELDMRNCDTLGDVLHRLTSLSYASEQVLVLSKFRSAPNWRRWSLPQPVLSISSCLHLELEPNCSNMCRRNTTATADSTVRKGKWPELSELESEPGFW